MVIKFNKQEVIDAEKYFRTAHLSERQKMIVGPIAKIIGEQINISERAVKGFI